MKNAFDFDFFCSFPSFWWSGGGYGSATVTGRYFFSFFFLVKRPQWLSESLWWVNCFLFFVAVVCSVFLRSTLNIHTKLFFFSFKFFFWSSISIFWSSWAHWHAQQWWLLRAGAGTWARLPGRYATPTSLDQNQVVVAKTKHAALFVFFLNPRLCIFFRLIWFVFENFEEAPIPSFIVQ